MPVPPLAIGRMPVTPVVNGRPVAFVRVTADGVPRLGVTNVGDVASTMPPDPVTFWPSAVCTPVPKDVMPVPPAVIGKVPVVSTDADVAYIAPPDVNDDRLVPPLAVGRTPLTCVVRPILPHDGATPTPPEISALPVTTSLRRASVFEESA